MFIILWFNPFTLYRRIQGFSERAARRNAAVQGYYSTVAGVISNTTRLDSFKLKYHGTILRTILVASSRGCHEEMLRGRLLPWNLSFIRYTEVCG